MVYGIGKEEIKNTYFGVDPTGLIWYRVSLTSFRPPTILELTPQG